MKTKERTYNAGPYSDPSTAFIYCVDCDEMITEGRVASHKADGHKVETTKKPMRNSGLGCICGHSGDDHDMAAQGEAPCRKCKCYTFRSNGIFDKSEARNLENKIHQPTEDELRRYHIQKNHGGMYGQCKECSDIFYGRSEMKNDDAEDEKEGLKKSMSEPAKVKNADDICPTCGHSDESVRTLTGIVCGATGCKCNSPWHKPERIPDRMGKIKNTLELAVARGLLTNMAAQKLSTREGYPKPIQIKYIMPGLVEYEYMNDGAGARVLVTKNALDKMLADPEKSIVGKPIINEAHREVSPDDYKNGKADGIVTRAWYEPSDGWYYCEGLVWDEETRQNIQNGYSVSCEYTALAPWGPAGQLNQVTYDKEVTDGRYKHLAVVSGPRYEGAKIMNSTGGKQTMKLLQWLKKGTEDVKNSVDVDSRTAVEIDGKEVPLENAIAAWKESEAAKAKAKADADALALKNAKVLSDDDIVTIDGKQVKVADLKNAMAAQVKNASEEKMEKDHKDGEHKDKDMDNCPMCNAEDDEEEEKEKKEKDAKNALIMNSQHKSGQHIQPNEKCAICDGITAERLTNAAKMREGKLPSPVVPSVGDGLKRGKAMFGKTQKQQESESAAK